MKIEVIPNRSEKYMTSFLNKNLVSIDSMQFMSFSLENLVKNLPNNDFKYLTEEFGSHCCLKNPSKISAFSEILATNLLSTSKGGIIGTFLPLGNVSSIVKYVFAEVK